MKSLKQLTCTVALVGVIMMGVSNSYAGIIVNFGEKTTKTSTCQQADEKKDFGIIVNLTGIIVNLTGIIVNFGGVTKGQTNCGIIVNAK